MYPRNEWKQIAVTGLRVLTAMTLLLTAWLSAATAATAQVDGEQYVEIWISALTCDSDGYCYQDQGVQFTVTTEEGAFLGACTQLSYRAPCHVFVPLGTLVVVTQDVSTLPDRPCTLPVENPLYLDVTTGFLGVAFDNVRTIGCDDDSLVDELVAVLIRILQELLNG